MKGRYHFGDLGIDGKIILRWVLKYDMRLQTGFMGVTGVSSCECSNNSSGNFSTS
jgi:hypothetical protein